MKRILLFFVTGITISLIAVSCKKDDVEKEQPVPAETIATNNWIHENMDLYYLWRDKMPANIDRTKESDPEKYFYKLIYDEKDRWSYITDDYKSLQSDLAGTPVSMGYNPAFFLAGPNKVVIVVNYVYPDSPASSAGLKRGDIILTIDNQNLDTVNYYQKYSAASYTVELGTISGTSLVPTGQSLSLTARLTAEDPSLFHKVIDISGHKVGYLVYVSFTSGANNEYITTMDAIFNEFKTAGVTDMVVDMRYNPGGDVDAAVHLASNIAPSSVSGTSKTFVRFNYNNDLQQYIAGQNDLQDMLLYTLTPATAGINMQRVFFLTTSRTASASELVIIGLRPYMNVVHIGEATYGKYAGSWVMPDDNKEWAMMPIVFKYSNSAGYTDFENGLTPDYLIEDNVFRAVPFGDITDPMLAKAVSLISGKSVPGTKSETGPLMLRKINPKEMERNLTVPVQGHMPVVK